MCRQSTRCAGLSFLRHRMRFFTCFFHEEYVLDMMQHGSRCLLDRKLECDFGKGSVLLPAPGAFHACAEDVFMDYLLLPSESSGVSG